MCNNGPQRGFDTYSPSIVNSFGYGNLKSNAMASVGFWLQVPLSYCFSFVSDHFNRRGETVLVGLACHLLGYVFNLSFSGRTSKGVRYFGVIWTQAFGTFSHPLNIAWMSLTARDSEERALAMAMVIMGANTAGIYGAQIFRSDDKPLYRRAFGIGIGVLTVGLLLAAVRYIDHLITKRRAARAPATPPNELETPTGSSPASEKDYGSTEHSKV
jgi:MFS family permease